MTPYQKWVSFYTIVRKDFVRIMRIWPQTFLPSIITSALYFTVFGAFLGSRIGAIQGVPYIMFVVPGLVMLSVVTNSYANVATVMFQSKFFMRTIDEILVSPTPPWIIVAGFVTTGLVRGVSIGALVLIVALFFTHLTIYNAFAIIAFLVLTSLVFSLGGFINGVYAKSIDGINIIPTFVLTPLLYLGGVFYSSETLPGAWGLVTKLDPVFYIINGFRYGFLGISDVPVWMCAGVLVAAIALFTGVSLYLIKTGLGLRQ
ncbi:MAG TPA: ABC transporter permease [Candidatus Paceibacterota bacterium]